METKNYVDLDALNPKDLIMELYEFSYQKDIHLEQIAKEIGFSYFSLLKMRRTHKMSKKTKWKIHQYLKSKQMTDLN